VINIAYLSQYDATDVRSWSGTGRAMARCLNEAGFKLNLIGPLRNQMHPVNVGRYLTHKYLLRQEDHPQRDPGFLRHFALQAEQKLAATDADLVFAPGGLPLSYLRTTLPVVMWTDCTFSNLLDYYPKFSNLSARSVRNGHEAERRALNRCNRILFASQWAADSAINDYGIGPDKIRIVPFGSNMSGAPQTDIERLIAQRLAIIGKKVYLSLVGVDWYRKGVDLAAHAVSILVNNGINAELTVVGCAPPDGLTPSHVRITGFIDKSRPEGVTELAGLFEGSHLFVLPSRAECYGVVLCEAAAYGLPSLASETGGIGSVVVSGITGQTFDPKASPQVWADHIAALVRDPSRYAALCRSAYNDFRQRLNWTASGKVIKQLIEELIPASARAA
jgi:glycosyltransferase involved in cell wall biosynthesis